MAPEEAIALFGVAERSDARLELLVRQHFQFVWRTLRRFGLPRADADDAAQQVFLVAAQKLNSIGEGKEKSFLFGVATNMAARVRRSSARRRLMDDEQLVNPADGGPGLDELLEKRRARRLLDQILREMSEPLRSVFVLHELEQMTQQEIATVLDVPMGTVASRLRRAREVFRRALALRAPFGQNGGSRDEV